MCRWWQGISGWGFLLLSNSDGIYIYMLHSSTLLKVYYHRSKYCPLHSSRYPGVPDGFLSLDFITSIKWVWGRHPPVVVWPYIKRNLNIYKLSRSIVRSKIMSGYQWLTADSLLLYNTPRHCHWMTGGGKWIRIGAQSIVHLVKQSIVQLVKLFMTRSLGALPRPDF